MSDRIIIDIAVDEFEFIKEAIAFKARSLISYLDTCKEHHEEQQAVALSINEMQEIKKEIDDEFDKEYAKNQVEWNKPVKRRGRPAKAKVDAPTPKKRGRPAKVAV